MPSTPSIRVERAPHGLQIPYATNIGSPPANLFGTPGWQVGAVSFTTQTVTIPVLTANVAANVQFASPFQNFPSFILQKNGTAIVIASVFPIGQPSDPSTIVSQTSLVLQFGVGNAFIGVGGSTFILNQPGAKYGGAVVNATARFLSATGTAATQTVQFAIQATLLGQAGGNS